MVVNRQVWQEKCGVAGVIREGQVPSKIEDGQVLVKVHTWALNPCDTLIQDQELPFIKYPIILGQDVAGTVEAVGTAAASKFKLGDRVFGFTANNGFQEYVTLDHRVAAKVPEGMKFNDVVVFPLCISTAAMALFHPDYLDLPRPSLNPSPLGKSILIWGGSSAVGSNAIQMCKAAGLEVITTCSPRTFDYVKGIGADKVFDYNSPSVIEDLVAEVDKGECLGIYMAAGKVSEPCKVSAKSKQDLFVATTNPIMEGDVPDGVRAKFTFATGGLDDFEVTFPITFGGFLPDALAAGKYKVAPPPQIVSPKGLEGIQEAMDIMKKGISGTKLIIEAN